MIFQEMKTYNLYCDESCHLERDEHQYMIIAYVSCAANQVRLHNSNIRKLKSNAGINSEVKWVSLSKSGYPLYNDLIDYFFATDLQYRAIVIDKSHLKHEEFKQNHDDFYYKMYYQLLSKKILPENNYNIYLDIKDTRSAKKVHGLQDYLNRQYFSVKKLQNIKSHEVEMMQLTDIITGALNYHLRGLTKVIAKTKIIQKIQQHSKLALNRSTAMSAQKVNLFFIDLK
jgi:Protein of unknown function (DUF3800)